MVVDCSNRTARSADGISNAERLQSLLPANVPVVKAFNTLSAYALESGEVLQQPRQVSGISKKNTSSYVITLVHNCEAWFILELVTRNETNVSSILVHGISALPGRLRWLGIYPNYHHSLSVTGQLLVRLVTVLVGHSSTVKHWPK